MAKASSKRLVIDASVARSAGPPNSSHPTSSNCREFLQEVLKICHRVVMTPEIRDEWNKHKSRFAQTWLATMRAKGKIIYLRDLAVDQNLWRYLENMTASDSQRAEIIKDIHLLEAALAADKAIISLDENTARKFFTAAAPGLPSLQTIVWVNPDRIVEEQPIDWLEKGALPETQRLLGYVEEQ